ncbi:hypothetical protein HRbin01_00926 [archaeon HR01]|nr:hypothetical protein HRbin01_00926 [archaeon HR01]
MSSARIPISVTVENLATLTGELHRYAAPTTVMYLCKLMPLEGFIARWDYAIYIVTSLSLGAEKTAAKISAGDIFYWPPGKAVGIAFKDKDAPAQTVRVGKIDKNFEILEKAGQGARLRLSLRPPSYP